MDTSGQQNTPPSLVTCDAHITTEAARSLFKESNALPLSNFLALEVAHLWDEIGMSLGLPEAIRAECGESRKNAAKLCNILLKWITGKYPGAVPATMKELKEALAGPFVEHGVLASKLEQYKQPVKETTTPSDDAHKASFYGKESRDTLVRRYSREPEVVGDLWPPVVTENFVNLALVEPSDKSNKSDYSVSGNADTKIASKVKIEYREAFGQFLSESNILVIGRPGSGKTTLFHKIVKDWAKGEALEEAEVVFLISLRAINTKQNRDTSLFDILRPYYRQAEDFKSLIKRLEQTHGKQACFVLDGFDEYNPSDKSDSLISALLDKSYLPNAMVIMSSRPAAASANLNDELLSKKIEVFGFPSDQVHAYIDCFPFSCSDGLDAEHHRTNLKEYLRSHPDVADLCYLPVTLAIICFIYECEPNDIPQTLTKVYETFARLVVIRHLSKKRGDKKVYLKSLDYLDEANFLHFRELCKRAFKMTSNAQLVIREEEFDPDDSFALGLATVDVIAHLCGFQNSYSFLHLTLQEYLAAYYISTLTSTKQNELIRDYSSSVHMLNVWKFYFGLIKFSKDCSRAQKIFNGINCCCPYSDLLKNQCAFESQRPDICKLSSSKSFTCDLSTSASDVTALAYVMSNNAAMPSSTPTTSLTLRGNGTHRMESLMHGLSNAAIAKLKKIDISGEKTMEYESIVSAARKLQHANLTELHLRELSPDYTNVLIKNIHLENLTKLCLCGTKISSSDAVALAKGLENNCHLKSLDLSDNRIGSIGLKALSEILKNCSALWSLDLSENDINVEDAEALGDLLNNCDNLKCLEMSRNSLGAHSSTGLRTILKSLTRDRERGGKKSTVPRIGCPRSISEATYINHLGQLRLSDNGIDLDCAMELSHYIIEYCPFITNLNLSRNIIGSAGVIKVFLKLLDHPRLCALCLSHNAGDSSKSLPKILTKFIDLSHNNINSSHIAELADGLRQYPRYTQMLSYCDRMRGNDAHLDFDLSFNNVYIDDAKQLLCALCRFDAMLYVGLMNNPIHNDANTTAIFKEVFQHPAVDRYILLHPTSKSGIKIPAKQTKRHKEKPPTSKSGIKIPAKQTKRHKKKPRTQ